MNRLVLDCSVTMAWCFENESDPRAEALLDAMSSSTAYVPGVWALEVANVLIVAERRGRLSEADADAFVSRIQEMSIEEEPIGACEVLNRMRSVAGRYGLSAYDAAYLELAMRLGIALGTLDAKLAQAAESAGVQLALR